MMEDLELRAIVKHLNSDEIEKIEKHQLPDTKAIYWRNSKLDFKNPEKLITSLELKPIKKIFLELMTHLMKVYLRFFLKKGANNIIYHKNLRITYGSVVKYQILKKRLMDQHINID